jgi:cytochrome c oxidase subunit II
MQSLLTPAGVDAAQIVWLWWLLFGISVVVFIAVMGFLAAALLTRRDYSPEADATKTKVIAGAAVLTVITLFVILIASVSVGRATAEGPADAFTIEVTGHQWWWEVRYMDPRANMIVTSANEVHLPVGERVRFVLRSQDVIHSFWIPNLAGKIDMFPDRLNTLWVEATEPGVYRGQCAEFCGMQHGKMAFVAVAHEPEEFRAWLERERQNGATPQDDMARRGQEVFVHGTCGTCHRIRGTPALATFGPDLTHIGSRRTLGAGAVPNTRARLAAWILDPQQIKPGSHMPPTNLDPESLHALVYYLERLR